MGHLLSASFSVGLLNMEINKALLWQAKFNETFDKFTEILIAFDFFLLITKKINSEVLFLCVVHQQNIYNLQFL